MTWCNDCNDIQTIQRSSTSTTLIAQRHKATSLIRSCPSCGHRIKCQEQARINDLPGLPAGVKFDPTDQELLEHLEGKVKFETHNLHPLIDEFIPTIEGEKGICYTHPENLPGVSNDGLVRHFFHRPSKAYTTGTRKRRKVHTDTEGGETRWHKTGKTRPVFVCGKVKGYKKILVLYTNYGKQRKPEKTNWVMHQYHLGNNEEERDGEIVVSKVFYQTQPRQCGSVIKDSLQPKFKGQVSNEGVANHRNATLVEYYNSSSISFDQSGQNRGNPTKLLPHFFAVHDGSSFVP
ncbi:hypothetical protein K2173_006728 [Erythroxylum novogranatense]|uniref:NAC domain-containing protein n=1 Tax=Erythroxylum novogranatense TaxID=1862640 RepID=A0AAV8TCX1_9ROSI|nr:hypothetical protein K2173_006728 [Erythroxylum novogranatense]